MESIIELLSAGIIDCHSDLYKIVNMQNQALKEKENKFGLLPDKYDLSYIVK
jgi:hypothetical protein